MSSDVVASQPVYDDEALGAIKSFDDALALLGESGVQITNFEDFGDGFSVIDDKRKLVDVPFVLLDWKWVDGDYGQPFVVMRVVTKNGDKFVVTDGGVGICGTKDGKQRGDIRTIERKGVMGGVLVKRGLVRSDYEYADPSNGEMRPAHTYYLGQ